MSTQQLDHLLFTVLCCLFFIVSRAQEFSTAIYFENEDGLRDTIVVGYDPMATTGMDSVFQERDIIDEAYDGLDIRVTRLCDFCLDDLNFEEDCLFQTKVNIVPKECNLFLDQRANYSSVMQIIIPNKQLPLQINWDSSQFNNPCLGASVLTDWTVVGWWDLKCHDGFLGIFRMSSISNAYMELPAGEQIINDQNDTFSILQLGLLHRDIGVNNEELELFEEEFSVFPNPVRDFLQVAHIPFEHYNLYDRYGKVVLSGSVQNQINMTPMQQGLYFLELVNDNKVIHTYKLIKK